MRTSLRRKLLWLLLPLALIPFLATAFAAYSMIIRGMLDQAVARRRLLLVQTVSTMGQELNTARKELEYLAELSLTKMFLASEDRTAGGADTGQDVLPAMRDVAEGLFQQNPNQLELIFVDRKGRKRLHLSKLEGDPCPLSLRNPPLLIDTWILKQLQSPIEKCPAGLFSFLLAHSVVGEELTGLAVIRFNATALERALRPLLANNQLSIFLFDDRGLIFGRSLASREEERMLQELDLQRYARELLENSSGELWDRPVKGDNQSFLFSAIPAEEFINFREPVAGENWFLGVLES